jgi:elongation factor P
MLSFNELKRQVRIVIDNEPYEIIEASPMFKGRGQSVLQAKIKNLKTNNVLSRTFRPSERFLEAEISKMKVVFLYVNNKEQYFFCEEDNPKDRFFLEKNQLGSNCKFLKEKQNVEGLLFENQIINISLPVKISLEVVQAPPGVKGDRAQAGNKPVKLETGAEIQAPLFIKEGDVIEINTEKQEYVRRI